MVDTRTQVLIPYHFGTRWDPQGMLGDHGKHWRVHDNGWKSPPPRLMDRLITTADLRPGVVVSGDCMAAITCHRPELTLVWMDAHGDYHTPQTTLTGSLGGMPLSMLCGGGWQDFMRACNQPFITDSRKVIHVGGSEFDPGERETMLNDGIKLNVLPPGNRRLHLHIDTDVISSKELSGAVHPAPNGIRLADFWEYLTAVRDQVEVLSIKTPDPHKREFGPYITRDILEFFNVPY